MSSRFNWPGFICALLSTIIGVWQSIYLKMLMHMGMDRNYVLFVIRFFYRTGPPMQRPAQLLHSVSDRRVLRGASVDLPIDSLGSRVYQRVPAVSELDLLLFGVAVRRA